MNKRITGPNQRPNPHPFYGDHYERGKDPWHVDAFEGTGVEKEAAEHPDINKGERGEGWFLLDGWDNPIGFIPDGTPVVIPAEAGNDE